MPANYNSGNMCSGKLSGFTGKIYTQLCLLTRCESMLELTVFVLLALSDWSLNALTYTLIGVLSVTILAFTLLGVMCLRK